MGETKPRGARRFANGARGFVRARNRKQKLGGVAAVVLLASAPFGGLKAEPTPAPEKLVLGQKYDIGPLDVTVEKVETLKDLAPAVTPQPGDRLLVVEVKVTNSSRRAAAVSEFVQAVTATGTGAVPWPYATVLQPRVFDVNDSGEVNADEYINPGITNEYALVLQQAGDWKQQPLTVRLQGYRFQTTDPQGLDPDAWLLSDILVEGKVPVVVKP